MNPQQLVHDALEVVTFPPAAVKVLQLLQDPGVNPQQIADALALDPPLASRVLRIANSPFFLGQSPVDELSRAVVVLGTALLRDLVLGAAVVRAFQGADIPETALDSFWERSIGCGSIAAELALTSSRRLADVAFTAGLMHDLGELPLLVRFPGEMREISAAVAGGDALQQAESARFGFGHAEVGEALAKAWHFPDTLVECMSFHHCPEKASEDLRQLVSIIHIASRCVPLLYAATTGRDEPPIDPGAWAFAEVDPAQLPDIIDRARERVEAMQAALL